MHQLVLKLKEVNSLTSNWFDILSTRLSLVVSPPLETLWNSLARDTSARECGSERTPIEKAPETL